MAVPLVRGGTRDTTMVEMTAAEGVLDLCVALLPHGEHPRQCSRIGTGMHQYSQEVNWEVRNGTGPGKYLACERIDGIRPSGLPASASWLLGALIWTAERMECGRKV